MLDRLQPRPGATHRKLRVGRGPGSGKGKTCGRGVKGQGKRQAGALPSWFEGGQMPITRRIPKRGFTNNFRRPVEIVNTGSLGLLGEGATIDVELLARRGLIHGSGARVKLLAEGDPPRGIRIKVHKVSAAAKRKIEEAGGSVELIG